MHVNQILKQYFHSCMLDMRAASVKTEIEYRAEIIQYHSFLCLVFFFFKVGFYSNYNRIYWLFDAMCAAA